MSDQGSSNPTLANGQEGPAVRMMALGQYVKDLSFENPGAPLNMNARPQIDLGVDIQARRIEGDRFESEIKLRVSAVADGKSLFLLELVYAGLFQIQNVPEDFLQQILLIDAPHILFPFARRVVADTIRDGGMPPLMIEPIDFAGLFRAKQAEAQKNGDTPVTANA
jgi:preprotein translocase subunit SecB